MLGELVARGKASGVEVRTPFGQLAEVRDGLIFRLHGFAGHDDARRAAGL